MYAILPRLLRHHNSSTHQGVTGIQVAALLDFERW